MAMGVRVTVDTGAAYVAHDAAEYAESYCPACGEPIDYCQGHGEMGDPDGAAILAAHDDGYHASCNSRGCDDAPAPRYVGLVLMGANYAAPDAATGAYVWNTLDGVRASVESIRSGRGVDALVAEWRDNGAAGAGEFDDSLTPCADDVRVYVYANGPGALEAMEESLDYAERVVYVGPRGGVRVSADLTAGAR